MTRRVSLREKQIMAAAVLVLAVLVTDRAVAVRVAHGRDLERRIGAAVQELRSTRKLVASEPEIAFAEQGLSITLAEGSPDRDVTSFLSRLDALAKSRGLTVATMRPVGVGDEASAAVVLSGDWPAVRGFFVAVHGRSFCWSVREAEILGGPGAGQVSAKLIVSNTVE